MSAFPKPSFAAPPRPSAHTARRRCLGHIVAMGAAGTLALSSPARALLSDPQLLQRPRSLWVTRPQSGEVVRAVYWADQQIQWEGYEALNHLYRDLHAQAQQPIALGLLHLNFLMQTALALWRRPRPLVLLSGYRTRRTNAEVGGSAGNIHGTGQADDYVYEGLSLPENLALARAFQVGGLGFYPERGSLHKDVGPLRSWVGRGPAGH